MGRGWSLVLLFCVTAMASGTRLTAQAGSRAKLDWDALATVMVERMQLQPGERVLLLAHPDLLPELVIPLRREVVRAGGIDVGVMLVIPTPARDRWGAFASPTNQQASRIAYREMFQDLDLAVMMPGATTDHPAYLALQDLVQEGRGRTMHFHWQANGSVIGLPGQPLPALHVVDLLYQRTVMETDYQELAEVQQRFEEAMRSAPVRVTTPEGTDLRFRIGDRPVNRQDGDASSVRAERGRILIDREIELPAGAVRVAPLEETVSGVIVLPVSRWDGRAVYDLTLRIEAGRVTEVDAGRGLAFVEAEMDGAGEAGRRFREFALGFNPFLAVPDKDAWIPYYGYGAGVVRLSLGDNSELGGVVTGGYVRWNFFTNATVIVGDEVWVRNGEMMKP